MKRGRQNVRKFTMASSPDDEASLEAMKYRDLQKVAKEVGVKANLPKAQLIQKIMEAKLSKAAEDRVESAAAPPSPKATTPKAKIVTPKAKTVTPKAKIATPKAKSVTPKVQQVRKSSGSSAKKTTTPKARRQVALIKEPIFISMNFNYEYKIIRSFVL